MPASMVEVMAAAIGAGLSIDHDPRIAAIEAAQIARAGLHGAPADLVVLFAAGAHLAAPQEILDGVHEALAPGALVGCGAGGVLAEGQEVETGTALAVWAASFDGGEVSAFHASVEEQDEGIAVTGLPELDGAAGLVLLPDPYSFPTDGLLSSIHAQHPGLPVLGGLTSARTLDGAAALFLGDEVVQDGAVGLVLDGVEMVPCVSQGAVPVGPEMTITAAEGNVIHELAGRPALERLRTALGELDPVERAQIAGGLLFGIVIDQGQPEYGRGDFLIRSLLGADEESGALAVGAAVLPGQVVRLHARDAASADKDLHEALSLVRTSLGGSAAGALVFACNGRGSGMFGTAGHDAAAVASDLGAPAAGFFAAGEIGPVAGENFLHGFTATLAVFAP